MKSLLLITTLLLSSSFAFAGRSPTPRQICVDAFKQDTLQTFHGTNATSIRMSSRVNIEEFAANDPSLVLLEITANFYVKWPDNYGEVPSLGGGSYVYDSRTGICESADIVEFAQLKKR